MNQYELILGLVEIPKCLYEKNENASVFRKHKSFEVKEQNGNRGTKGKRLNKEKKEKLQRDIAEFLSKEKTKTSVIYDFFRKNEMVPSANGINPISIKCFSSYVTIVRREMLIKQNKVKNG